MIIFVIFLNIAKQLQALDWGHSYFSPTVHLSVHPSYNNLVNLVLINLVNLLTLILFPIMVTDPEFIQLYSTHQYSDILIIFS